MAQLEPQEKVLVSEMFLESTHGEVACEDCHNGNPKASKKAAAHKGMEPHPSIVMPEKACGDCHEEIVATAKDSLHATLSTFPTILKTRSDPAKWHQVDKARQGHCAGCHTSCGGCHVSRPKFAKKGFVDGHMFNKKSDPINQCTACHGSRVGMEYYGARGQGDVHASKYNMDCVACHKATEMHAAAPAGLPGRYHLKEIAQCTDCHQGLEHGSVRDHTIHIGKVQCQVCHSQTYVNCYSCHTGKDDQGIKYFVNQKEVEDMKIGRNYDPKAQGGKDFDYMLVRHEPSDLEVFDFYVKDAFTNFDNTPNWKRTSPHNIQRKTWQNATCNNCHGQRDLFLAESDLLDYEKKANKKVVVKKVPKKIKKTMALKIDTSKVRKGMVVDAAGLHKKMGAKGLTIIDARPAGQYAKGHIKGAINFNPLAAEIRQDSDDDNALELLAASKIAKQLGKAGIKAGDHLVVYDKNGRTAGFLLWILQYLGADNVSYLKGGIEGWHEAGYHTSKDAAKVKAGSFGGKVNGAFLAGNDMIAGSQDDPQTVILDVRLIHQAQGQTKHGLAGRGGSIPGSINVPLGALFMENGDLKSPEELLWMLKTNGITPDKTVITSCNTGQQAGDAFFILRYLGFDQVRVHDASWIGWCSFKE